MQERALDVSMLGRLPPKARRGSKARCHWMTHGDTSDVARRLTALSEPWAIVADSDHWMPMGFEDTEEAQLHDAPRLLKCAVSRVLMDWWLPDDCTERRTPNFDIASTCRIGGRRGLLLVEAKAHDIELRKEEAGRTLGPDATAARKASHVTIGRAIDEAAEGLRRDTGLRCQLSRDNCYQMSNRLAWSWKLATLGIPVVLVYLGFLRAREMADRGLPFESHDSWDEIVREHSAPLVDGRIWNSLWMIDGTTPFIPVIASSVAWAEQLPPDTAEIEIDGRQQSAIDVEPFRCARRAARSMDGPCPNHRRSTSACTSTFEGPGVGDVSRATVSKASSGATTSSASALTARA